MDPSVLLDLFAVVQPADGRLRGPGGLDGVDQGEGLVDVLVFEVAVLYCGWCCWWKRLWLEEVVVMGFGEILKEWDGGF